MSIIISSDIHLDAAEENEYRFHFLDHLMENEGEADHLVICGDFLDKKDNHSAVFVNKVINYLYRLAEVFEVHIIYGNHDGLSSDSAYLRFTNKFEGVYFYTEPLVEDLNGSTCLFLPNTRDPVSDWANLDMTDLDFIFMHQTITGAKASNGYALEGLSVDWIKKNMNAKHMISGDIHLHQQVGPVTYVGAPFHTKHGENFIPRYFLYDGKKLKSITYDEAPRKVKFHMTDYKDLEDLDLRQGDYLKVDLHLPKTEFVSKAEYEAAIKAYCEEHGIILKGIKIMETQKPLKNKKKASGEMTVTKSSLFEGFCKNQKLDKYRKEVGEELMG